jgi:hypothetical protein
MVHVEDQPKLPLADAGDSGLQPPKGCAGTAQMTLTISFGHCPNYSMWRLARRFQTQQVEAKEEVKSAPH